VADTYNHKLKIMMPDVGSVKTWLGASKAGFKDGSSPQLSEPTGFAAKSVGHDTLVYFADSNNHCIRRVLLSSTEVETPLFNEVPVVNRIETTTEIPECKDGICKYVPKG